MIDDIIDYLIIISVWVVYYMIDFETSVVYALVLIVIYIRTSLLAYTNTYNSNDF